MGKCAYCTVGKLIQGEIMKKKIRYFILGLLLFFLTACQSEINPILEDSPCAPPCWYNLTPRITTLQESLQIIENLKFVGDYALTGRESQYILGRIGKKYDLNILFEDNVIKAILINGSPVFGTSLRVKQAIKIYGEPDQVYIHKFSAGDTHGYLINLLYPEKGLFITSQDGGLSGFLDIKPNDRVYEIIFVDPDSYYEIVIHEVEKYEVYQDSNLLLWKGYQIFELPAN